MVARKWKSVSVEQRKVWKERAKLASADDDDLIHCNVEVNIGVDVDGDDDDDDEEDGHVMHEQGHPHDHMHVNDAGVVMGDSTMDVVNDEHDNGIVNADGNCDGVGGNQEGEEDNVRHEHVQEVVHHLVGGTTEIENGKEIKMKAELTHHS